MAPLQRDTGGGGLSNRFPLPDGLSSEAMVGLYRSMVLLRKFELAAQVACRTGETPGFLHLYVGQEATASGICAHLQPTDWITSTHRGHGHALAKGMDPRVLPRVVVYDPELTFTLPPAITGPSAMNALAHCVEAFYGPGANPITALVAEEGIRALAAGVPVAVSRPHEPDGRSETLYGAYLAGAAFAVSGSGLHHKICHVLGGAYDLPHAELHTVVLPQVVAFQAPALPEVMERVARALGGYGRDGAAAGLHELALAIGAPTALRDIGMREADLDEAAGLVLEKVPDDNPRPVSEDDVRQLLQAAFEGRRPAGG